MAETLWHGPLAVSVDGFIARPDGAVADELEAEKRRRVWVAGGGKLVADLIALDRLDRLDLCVVPIVLGDGLRLIPYPTKQLAMRLVECASLGKGVVRLVYDRA